MFARWHVDPLALAVATGSAYAYLAAVRRNDRLRRVPWPRMRTLWFFCGIASALVAIESPLDAAAETHFAPHMVQHLILTNVAAPLVLLGAPLLLVLSAAPTSIARRIVAFLRGPIGQALAFPPLTWGIFVVTLWSLHFTGAYEAALEHERVHVFEHALYFGAALLFWFPVIAIGPTPWSNAPFAYPLRMIYLILAMPTQAALGFALYSERHVLYARYAVAGLADQQHAGEIMWVAGSLFMVVPLLLVGYAWSRAEERAAARADAVTSAGMRGEVSSTSSPA